ncbi:MAG: efflux RND transporter periplasmic adaptor subunit [Gammaproteobacteria bacterium]
MDKQLIKRFVILGVFLIVLFGAIFGWRSVVAAKTQAAMAKAGAPQVTVSAASVKQTNWASELQATASLQAVQGAMLTPQLAGMVTDIRFHSGTEVKKGQLLVQLNDSTQRAQLQNDESALKLGKIKLAQQRTLYKQHNASQLALQEADTTYTQAQAAVSSDRATIAKLQIRAPFAGHLGLRQVSLGQYVGTTTAVVNLQQWNPIYAVFQVPQQQLAQLATGQQVVLSAAGLKQENFTGKITAVGAQVQSGTRNVQVQATFANPDAALRPGMYGEVTVKTGQARKVLAVPDSAIVYNTYGSYVYVIAQGKQGLVAKEQNVQTGDSRNGLTIVARGLKANERVVTSGQVKLHSGAAVTIAPAAASTPNTATADAAGSAT